MSRRAARQRGAQASGLVHAIGFYRGDEDFARIVAPFCQEGLEAGEPTLVRLGERESEVLRDALPDDDAVVFLRGDEQYRHPPGALASTLSVLHSHGGHRVRILGEIPTRGGLSEDAWMRYEATVNRALDGYPLTTLCAYDIDRTSAPLRAELLRTHHVLQGPDGAQEAISSYQPPEDFLRTRRRIVRDPMEVGQPAFELVDPDPVAVRRALVALTSAMRLGAAAGHDLLVSANEVLTNALMHGRQPVVVRGWGRCGRVVVAVRDAGEGPQDPFVGILPTPPREPEGGRGLQITHRLCLETALSVDEEGFTVRLAAGVPEQALPAS